MSALPLIALGGILGSTHCLGMCGGFALSLGLGARGPAANLARQLVYSAGRIFTYAFLGAAAGFAGAWFARRSTPLIHAQALLSLVAGVLLIAQGASALGLVPVVFRKRGSTTAGAACLAGSFVRPFLASPRWYHVFVAGMLNGFLPCGLVYGYLALASSSASLTYGVLAMACFGAGTVPLMVLAGLGAAAFPPAARRGLFRLAGVCVLATGLGALARGVVFHRSAADPQCPGCRPAASSGGVVHRPERGDQPGGHQVKQDDERPHPVDGLHAVIDPLARPQDLARHHRTDPVPAQHHVHQHGDREDAEHVELEVPPLVDIPAPEGPARSRRGRGEDHR
jgi:sulfite exporter TauE/SafE